jgi:5'-methylthioadenosine phosphorylase
LKRLKNRLKSLEKIKTAIIAGSGVETLFSCIKPVEMETPYGTARAFIEKAAGRKIVFLPRHGPNHSVPPHKINYRANICALNKMGVERVLATNAVGAINQTFKPGDFAVPHDFVDFTKRRCATFYDEAPVTHIDVSDAYCQQMRELMIQAAKNVGIQAWDKAVLVCTEGPRLETPAEINMFRQMGCDLVGMTSFPEVVLSKEVGICYASICYISNMAAGMQERLAARALSEVSKRIMPKLGEMLIKAVQILPLKRNDLCTCVSTLRNARLQ